MTAREHWDRVYATKGDADVSWFEATPSVSLAMMRDAGLTAGSCVVDIGGGNSRLVDALLAEGLTCIALLDVSPVAIEAARARLGRGASVVTWIAADVTSEWSLAPVDIWHDRAVFHFLTAAEQRAAYQRQLRATVREGGHAIIATFALDGPARCSGLPVRRYSPQSLASELGGEFVLVDEQQIGHRTPMGTTQSFQYSRFQRTRR